MGKDVPAYLGAEILNDFPERLAEIFFIVSKMYFYYSVYLLYFCFISLFCVIPLCYMVFNINVLLYFNI